MHWCSNTPSFQWVPQFYLKAKQWELPAAWLHLEVACALSPKQKAHRLRFCFFSLCRHAPVFDVSGSLELTIEAVWTCTKSSHKDTHQQISNDPKEQECWKVKNRAAHSSYSGKPQSSHLHRHQSVSQIRDNNIHEICWDCLILWLPIYVTMQRHICDYSRKYILRIPI